LADVEPVLGASTDENGRYRIEEVPIGRYRLTVSYVGYETVMVAELSVEAGKEAVANVTLRERQQALGEVVVKAAGLAPLQTVSTHTITVEEQFRFPATFYDPARLTMSFPGVVGENDGTNIISVRGNSPGAVRWRLEGVDIVNPNHTANAGTFSDRPAQAAGGVNILSAQLLGASQFLSGAFPAEYGNALGGILDMRLRRGNDRQHEFTAQAGFLGLEAAAEGPLFAGKKRGGTFLANYRYSFTGLLTSLGVDFGDETTRFQDLSFNVSLPQGKAGQFSIFGVGGLSETTFRSPGDSAAIREDKERFDIDFESGMFAVGLTHVLPVGKKNAWRSVAAVSALEHRRTAFLAEDFSANMLWENDDFTERKIAFSSVFSHKLDARHRLKAGVQATQEAADFDSFFTSISPVQFGGAVSGWLLQPYLEWQAKFSPELQLTGGLRWSYFTYRGDHSSPEPRLALVFSPKPRQRWSLAYSRLSQMQLPQVYQASANGGSTLGFTRADHFVAGFRYELAPSLVFNAEAYFQYLRDVPVSPNVNRNFSVLNLTDFSPAYLTSFTLVSPEALAPLGTGRNYGIDLSLQMFVVARTYFLLSGSLYRSEYTAESATWHPTRFDGRHAFNLTVGREFSKQKEHKEVVKGVNARIAWLGGFRASPVDTAGSPLLGYTVYVEEDAFSEKQPDYFRLDLRLYVKWSKPGSTSLLSLDVQNTTNRRNVGFDFYDSVQQKVVTKRQLGLIPVLSYRVEF
jgi:hypothetical protein